jgi:hypothetical protein
VSTSPITALRRPLTIAALAVIIGMMVALFARHTPRGERLADSSPPLTTGAGEPSEMATPPAPPKLAAPHAVRIQADTRAPDYDAPRLLDLDVPVQELFANEPRDLEWAPKTERRISSAVQADFRAILPDAKIASVECKRLTCKKVITAAKRETLNKA